MILKLPRLLNKAAERSLCIGASGVKEYAEALGHHIRIDPFTYRAGGTATAHGKPQTDAPEPPRRSGLGATPNPAVGLPDNDIGSEWPAVVRLTVPRTGSGPFEQPMRRRLTDISPPTGVISTLGSG
jgi:hypothetical protein